MTVHLKDQAIRPCDDGCWLADVALGDGFIRLGDMVKVLRAVDLGLVESSVTSTWAVVQELEDVSGLGSNLVELTATDEHGATGTGQFMAEVRVT